MSECKEIDEALRRLGQKIDGYERALNNLDNRLNDLARKQAQCCNDKSKNNVDLTAIYKRLAKLERIQQAIYNYLTQGVKPIVDVIKNFIF